MFKKKKKDSENTELDLTAENEASGSKKEKNKGFTLYKFIFDIVVAALLLAFGILLLVKQDESIFIIFIVTAAVALIAATIRCLHILFKKKTIKPEVKRVILVLSIIHAIISIYLIIVGIIYNNELSGDGLSEFSKWNEKNYPIFLAVLLYSESVAYFMNTVLFKRDSKKFIFWMHIVFITLAVLILSFGNNFTGKKLVISIAVMAIVCAVLTAVGAFIGYNNFGNNKKKEESDKKEEPKEEDSKETILQFPEDNDNDSDSMVV